MNKLIIYVLPKILLPLLWVLTHLQRWLEVNDLYHPPAQVSMPKSTPRGICWRKKDQVYEVRLQIAGTRYYLGRYKKLSQAQAVLYAFLKETTPDIL